MIYLFFDSDSNDDQSASDDEDEVEEEEEVANQAREVHIPANIGQLGDDTIGNKVHVIYVARKLEAGPSWRI